METGEMTDISNHEERFDESVQGLREDAATKSNQVVNGNPELDSSDVNFGKHNDVHDGIEIYGGTYDQLTQIVMELSLQNDYLKAQIEGAKSQALRSVEVAKPDNGSKDEEASKIIRHLQERVNSLNKEIQGQRETQKAAENALEHLRAEYSEADGKVKELSLKLIEAQQLMEREIKERDEKHFELDSKFGRLHKRAKQKIQELQKEKDDLEARLHDINAKAEQTSSQQIAAQQEVERTRQQANEALRSMDAERQQLRATNNKLRDNVDELLRSLEAKESTLEGLQQSLLDKEQALAETQRALQALEEKQQLLILDLSAKHQKQVGGLEAQLADALIERSKTAETIASLQGKEKDSKISEMEAASSDEAACLGAALEEAKGELVQLKDKHEKERLDLEAGIQALRAKLEASESTLLRSEFEAAKMRSQLEFESSMQKQLLNTRETELVTAKDEISRLDKEFSAYKVRAHALLQKKDNEIAAAKNAEQLKAQEEAIKEAKKELATALEKRDSAIKELQEALDNHSKESTARDAALRGAENQIRIITMKLSSAAAHHQVERETWQKNLESVEESWRVKYAALEIAKPDHTGSDALRELEELKLQYKKLKEEHETFCDIAETTVEKKDAEILKLVEDIKNLSNALESRPKVDQNVSPDSAFMKQDEHILSVAAAEQQILLLARQQAQREEELAQSQRHILALQEEIEELERENHLHKQQEAMLKEEIRIVERSKKRDGVDMTYLKNVILKLLETGEVEALLPVIGMLLQFSPDEIRKCQQAYRSNVVASSPSASVESTPRSLFSRFSFTG
ncbi:protein GRIP [Phalaenopsis equestris]|uniref:protein GRIP n=1 Tax=Phalaenopsis equestris TaxID=78828 RepID=UPI0009E19097|nr:protein GRIP [Phalaenopsis equestris]